MDDTSTPKTETGPPVVLHAPPKRRRSFALNIRVSLRCCCTLLCGVPLFLLCASIVLVSGDWNGNAQWRQDVLGYDVKGDHREHRMAPFLTDNVLWDVYLRVSLPMNDKDRNTIFSGKVLDGVPFREHHRREALLNLTVPNLCRLKREDRFTATTVFLPSGHGHNLDDVFHLRVPWGDARESCEVDRKDIAYVRTDDLLYWPPALPVPGSSSPPFLLTRLSIDVFSEREILAHEKVVRWLDETGIERFPVNGSTFQKDAVSRTKKDHPACSFAYVQLYDRSCMVRDGHSSTWQYFPDFVNYGCRVRPLDLVRLKECNGVSGNPGAVINSIYPLRLRIIRSPEMYLTALQNNESNSMPWYRSADDPTTLRLQEDREMHNKMFGDTASWKEYATVQIKIYTGHAMLIAVIMHNTYWFRLNSTVGLSRESIFLTTMMLFWVRILNGTSHLNWIAYIAFGLRLRAALHPYIWVSRRGVKWGCHELQENERRSQRMDEQVGWRTRWAIVLAVVLLKPLCEQIHLPSPLTPRGVWEFYRKQTQVTTAGFIFDSLQANFNSRTKLFAGSYKVVRILDGLAMLVMIVLEDTTAGFPWPTALLTVVHVYQAVIYPTPSQAAGWADEAHRD